MGKIAVVTDTNCGLTPEQGLKMGVHIIPMPFYINDTEYLESVDMSIADFYKREKEGVDVHTSQASPASVLEKWDELLENHDQIVHIPMSSALSSSYDTAMMLSNDYEGRVFVVDNKRISITQMQSAIDAMYLAGQGLDGAQIRERLEAGALDCSIYIMLDTLTYLKKGGRITPTAAALGNLLRLKPVLQIQGEKLDAFAKARTSQAGKSIMINAIKKDIDERFGGDADNINLWVVHSDNLEECEKFREEVKEVIPIENIDIYELPCSIGVHIGPGSLAVGITKKVK